MRTIAVIGAGISGLAAARRLSDAGLPDVEIVVLEASSRVGGKLRREQVGGTWVDVGAEAMLARRPEGIALVRATGLGDRLIEPITTAARLRTGGANRPLPGRTLMGVPGDIAALAESRAVSDDAIARVRAEPELPPLAPLTEDVSVGALVEQRFGAEVVDRLVDPLLGGVYAGRARELSLAATIPALAERLRGGGSLLAATADLTRMSSGAGPVFASLDGGLASLPQAIARRLEVRLSTTVRRVERRTSGFRLLLGSAADPSWFHADAVVLATPAAKTAGLLAEAAPAASAELTEIDTASMAIITLAFPRADIEGVLPPGSGLLVPSVEGLQLKAMTFSSQKWPAIGTDHGLVLLRGSLGRAGETQVLHLDDADLVSLARRELALMTGMAASPVDSHVQRWGGALPQYRVGHVERVARIEASIARIPGLAVCGASYDGVGIPACIASAHTAADRIATWLRASAQ